MFSTLVTDWEAIEEDFIAWEEATKLSLEMLAEDEEA